jgi:hypothetical protein
MKYRFAFLCLLAPLVVAARAELRPDLDYFPSRLHATIYRN